MSRERVEQAKPRTKSHRVKWRLQAAATLMVLAAAGSIAVASPASAAGGGFYDPPSPLHCRNGDVLRDEPTAFFLDPLRLVQAPASARRILYCSTDLNGKSMAVSGTVLTPVLPWLGPGARPVVGYAIGTHGLGDQCAPSNQMASGTDLEAALMNNLLLAGYAVAVTDYQGLGTPGMHTYLMREPEGHAVLDSVRAAQRLTPANIPDNGPVLIQGFSQGGGAAAAAAELQPAYAPELDLKGVSAGLIPGDLAAIIPTFEASGKAETTLLLVHGLNAAYPKAGLMNMFNDAGRTLMADVADDCIPEMATRGTINTETLTTDGRTVSAHLIEDFRPLLDAQRYGNTAPNVPVYSAHSQFDDLLPYEEGKAVSQRWCARGAHVQFDTLIEPSHQLSGVDAATRGLLWFQDRIDGKPAPDNCGSI